MTDDPAMQEVQRTLGRIEGLLKQNQDEMRAGLLAVREEFNSHKQDDQRNFSSMRVALKDHEETRERHLTAQDKKLDILKSDADRAKGAGWVVLGLLTALATFLGTAVVAVLSGRISIH